MSFCISQKTTRVPSPVALALAIVLTPSTDAEAGQNHSTKARDGLETGQKQSKEARKRFEIPSARVGLDIGPDDALTVRTAFRLAYQRVLEVPTCGALFARLDLDGPAALSSTVYSYSRPGPERVLCNRGALAVARVGESEIRLCPKLRSLGQKGMAAILIHEALHTAGLGEWPEDPEAPTSREITLTVLDACSLG